MRAVAVGFVLVSLTAAASAQPKLYGSAEGKYAVAFPGQPRETEKNASTAVGEMKVTTLTYATADGNAYMVSYADFPAAATREGNLKALYEGTRDGVKKQFRGEVADEKDGPFGPDKLTGHEFVVKKDKTRVKMRVIVSGTRVYQVAVIGTDDFATGKAGTAFLDSFSVTK